MPNLKGRVALVTGGAAGLGKAIAQRLAAEGAQVVITDIQEALGNQVAAELGLTFLLQDVTDETRWTEVIEAVRSTHGALHILVNNAGMLSPADADLERARLPEWKRLFEVNVEAVFLGCRAAVPMIHASGGGSIINISSVAGIMATPFALAYGASKAAVRHLTKSIAQYCVERKLNIRCNSVHPGMVRTPRFEKGAAELAHVTGRSLEAVIQKLESVVPMGDLTQARDIAASVAFLASDESRHMTGAPLVIDGGLVYCDTYHTDLSGQR